MPTSEDLLVGQYAPMVRRLALQLVARLPSSVELDDLMQAGMMGLLNALRRYQASPDAQFETYAITRIRGAMLDELRSQDWLPRSVRSKAKDIQRAIQLLTHRLMRPPAEAEIAAELDLSTAQYQALLQEACGTQIVHYEDLVQHDGDGSDPLERAPIDSGQSHTANPLDQLTSGDLRRAVAAAIEGLPERERFLLSLQFEHDLNQKEIAIVMGLTEGRVSQLRSQAIVRIRAALAENAWHEKPSDVDYQALL